MTIYKHKSEFYLKENLDILFFYFFPFIFYLYKLSLAIFLVSFSFSFLYLSFLFSLFILMHPFSLFLCTASVLLTYISHSSLKSPAKSSFISPLCLFPPHLHLHLPVPIHSWFSHIFCLHLLFSAVIKVNLLALPPVSGSLCVNNDGKRRQHVNYNSLSFFSAMWSVIILRQKAFGQLYFWVEKICFCSETMRNYDSECV